MQKSVPVDLNDDILEQITGGTITRNELLDSRDEALRSQMDAAKESWEAHRAAAEKDFAANLSAAVTEIASISGNRGTGI